MKKPQFDFTDTYVLITGTTSGIGKILASGFVNAGAQVIVHGRDAKKTQNLANQLNTPFVVADLSSEQEIDKMINQLNSKYPHLHVLINNAGFEIKKPYEEFSMQEYDAILNVNTRSVFQLTKGVFPLLKKSGNASVINISSIHQKLPYPTNLPYCMSKAAMEMFTKVVGVEWSPYKIRVNTLAPGAIETEMNKDIINKIGRGIFSSWIGSGKIGTTEEVLQACLFLASDMSSYMTSETLYLDGALSKGLLPYGKTPVMQAMIKKLLSFG